MLLIFTEQLLLINKLKTKMTLTTSIILIMLLIGLASGALSGLVGVGGGIIIVPCLVFFLAFPQKMAQGTSLGILLLPAGILGVIQYYKQGQVDFRVVAIVAFGFIIGNYFGSKLALSISDKILKRIFAITLIIIAAKILFFDDTKKKIGDTNNTQQNSSVENI
jgi:uncharacterized membrane protein YfcA